MSDVNGYGDEYVPYQGGFTIDEFIDQIQTELTISCALPKTLPDANVRQIIEARALPWFYRNYQYAVQGAVDSSTRNLKLAVDTITTNAAATKNANLGKNKAPACNTPWPLNFSQSGLYQNKKICYYDYVKKQFKDTLFVMPLEIGKNREPLTILDESTNKQNPVTTENCSKAVPSGCLLNVTMSFSSSYTIYETQYKCTIRENEFNFTLNPTISSGSTAVTSSIGTFYTPGENLIGFATASYFNPYVTTVGLYDNHQNLLAIGKLSQPLPVSPTTDTTIIINIDR